MDSLYPALSGALAQEINLDIIANNLANINSTGFKKDFSVLSAYDPLGNDQPAPNGGKEPLPSFGYLDSIRTDFSAGASKQTGAPLDVAVDGLNFFAVQTPGGTRYTRNGSFTLNSQGQIVTESGYPVLGLSGPMTLPPGKISINQDGKVSVAGTEVDTFQVVQFSDVKKLTKTEGTLFVASDMTPVPSTEKRVQQGYIEGSNVNPVEEMVGMIRLMRLYEASQKVMQSSDAMSTRASNDIGKV